MPAQRPVAPEAEVEATWPTAERWSSKQVSTRWPAVAVALFVLLAAFSPSLLPRPWYMQAAAVGVGAGVGYLLTRLAQRLVRGAALLTGVRVVAPARTRRLLSAVAVILAVPAAAFWWYRSHLAHQQTARAVSMDPPSLTDDLLATAAGIGAAIVVVLVLLALRWVWLRISRVLKRVLPKYVSRAIALLLVLGALFWLTNDVLVRSALEAASRSAAETNAEPPEGLSAPDSELRSGSPQAAQPWEQLGYNGMRFTGSGPDADRIESVVGGSANDPIRVYAAPENGEDIEAVAERAVAELERTGAFDRAYLHLVTTTGAGWVEEFNAEAVEYLTGGDVATAAIQYSYLPSVIALYVDRSTPVEAGTALLEKVEAKLESMAAEDRPKLLVSGLSLGSFGGQGAFTDAGDMRERVDGAVWIGTPSFTRLWSQLTAGRHGGSPEIAPVIDDAEHIRFLTRPKELTQDIYGRSFGQWKSPRIAYVQYASDSMVWWDPKAIYREPDWMSEPRGHDVPANLVWSPIVTFAQLSIDTAASEEPPAGHGHIYQDDLVPTWAAVLDGLSDEVPGEVPGDDTHQAIIDSIREHLPPGASSGS